MDNSRQLDIKIAGLAIKFVVLSYGAAAVVCVAVPLSTIKTKLFNSTGAIPCKRTKKHLDGHKGWTVTALLESVVLFFLVS